MGLWSEMQASIANRNITNKKEMKRKVNGVQGCWALTDWTRLNESASCKTKGFVFNQGLRGAIDTNIKITKDQNSIGSWHDWRRQKLKVNGLFDFGGLYTSAHGTGFDSFSLISCTLKLEYVSTDNRQHLKGFLNISASPLPIPAVFGEQMEKI